MSLEDVVERVNESPGFRLTGFRFEVNVAGEVVLNTFGRRNLSAFDIAMLDFGKGIIDKKKAGDKPSLNRGRRNK